MANATFLSWHFYCLENKSGFISTWKCDGLFPSPWSLPHGCFVLLGQLGELALLSPEAEMESLGVTPRICSGIHPLEGCTNMIATSGGFCCQKALSILHTHKGTRWAAWPSESEPHNAERDILLRTTASARKGGTQGDTFRGPEA